MDILQPETTNEDAVTVCDLVKSTETITDDDSGVHHMLSSGYSDVSCSTKSNNNDLQFKLTEPPASEDAMADSPTPMDVSATNVDSAMHESLTADDKPTDEMISSQCSTFDANDIVFRRRSKKQKRTNAAPKKRVSFHEDILKNTKTDNIHIEHGFITYRGGNNNSHGGRYRSNGNASRYSWCSSTTRGEIDGEGRPIEDGDNAECNPDDSESDYVIYRNACSDVLDYGNSEQCDDAEDGTASVTPAYDNSGVFEYSHLIAATADDTANGNGDRLYRCHCSDSNSSLESKNSDCMDINSNHVHTRSNYAQSKSKSCDCIGNNTSTGPGLTIISDNCYFSEPNIMQPPGIRRSVWNKERKPKSSCLKKTKHVVTGNSFEAREECRRNDLSKKVQSFNVHQQLPELLGNGKAIFGSLKNMFSMPLAERGVPEGSEDIQAVHECVPDMDIMPVQTNPKVRPFLSKSLDGGFSEKGSPNKKKYIHTVDEQLRKKGEDKVGVGGGGGSNNKRSGGSAVTTRPPQPQDGVGADKVPPDVYRNKFIINCESTVFEHTGISYSYENDPNAQDNMDGDGKAQTPQPPFPGYNTETERGINNGSFLSGQISKLTSMFKSFAKEPAAATTSSVADASIRTTSEEVSSSGRDRGEGTGASDNNSCNPMECSVMSNSTMTDVSSIATASVTPSTPPSSSRDGFSKIFGGCGIAASVEGTATPTPQSPTQGAGTKTRHLASPLRKNSQTRSEDMKRVAKMSPDLFNNYVQLMGDRAPTDLRISSILSEDFDDILTITTNDTDRCDDMVIVDYPEITIPDIPEHSDYLKPYTKSTLINRFLRNVTQKKIMEATIKLNKSIIESTGGGKCRTGKPLSELYLKGAKLPNRDLIADLNAEIALEIEQNREVRVKEVEERIPIVPERPLKWQSHCEGLGAIGVDLFQNVPLPFIGKVADEFLMKVFKMYAGYGKDGVMAPVLVFLTNKTIYVTDLVRSALCNRFVMPYAELDIILLGPGGHTVLFCNGARDMQQVLLAGGAQPANQLVASLELCARRGGHMLPAIGQLTLDHLAPLQQFVRDTSKAVERDEVWLYYAVVSISTLNDSVIGLCDGDQSCGVGGGGGLSVNANSWNSINGPLMYRNVNRFRTGQWSASYFLLKAGVLYRFSETNVGPQKMPVWAVTLTECQGARRLMNVGRPHCFELILKQGTIQLAASDEYAASEWLQALVQSASGLFELAEEKPSYYGCTMALTSSHVITMREDFSEPLERSTATAEGRPEGRDSSVCSRPKAIAVDQQMDTSSDFSSSSVSTPTRKTVSSSSLKSATKLSSASVIQSPVRDAAGGSGSSYSNMYSQYGRGSGMEMLSCAAISQLTVVKVSKRRTSVWWCALEFQCQECVQVNSDDLVVHFGTSSEHERFLAMLEEAWHRNRGSGVDAVGDDGRFPLVEVDDEEDCVGRHCTTLFRTINRMWEPLLSAALGYPA